MTITRIILTRIILTTIIVVIIMTTTAETHGQIIAII
jgi:hypothetical protein